MRVTDAPEPGWLPDPHGGDFNRWWDGKHFTKRVQGEPPKADARTGAAAVEAVEVVEEELEVEESGDDAETDAAASAIDWPPVSTAAAVISGLGIIGAFLIPLGKLPLVVSSIGAAASVVALVLAIVAEERRVVAVWGIGLGLVGVAVGVTIGMTG